MKNSKFKRLLCLFIVTVMLMSGMSWIVSANEDMYSSWAEWDILMAWDVYKLGNEGTYSNFRGGFTWMKFTPVLGSLSAKFGIEVEWTEKDEYSYTRGETVEDLYIIISEALEIEEPGEALDYFIENDLIKGRAKGDYQLDKTCTTEEMIIFSVRVYEHIIRQLGEDSKGFFWKVTGENNTVYLLGSIHISDGSLYPLNKAIEDAFAGSGNFVVEVHDDQSDEDWEYYFSKGLISDGTTIADYLDPVVYELYVFTCEYLGIKKEAYDYLQPWLAEFELGYLLYAMTSEDDNIDDLYDNLDALIALGIESHFMPRAISGGKNILQLESIRHQADFLSSFSPELQEVLLFWTLVDFYELITGEPFFDDNYIDEDAEEIEGEDEKIEEETDIDRLLYNVWKTGDEKAMIELNGIDEETDDEILNEYNYIMLTKRNIAMVEKIIEYLTGGEGDYFVVVGAAHMVGRSGIVQLLIDAGYTVERVK